MTSTILRLRFGRRGLLLGAASAVALLAPARFVWARDKIGSVMDVSGTATGEADGGGARPLTKSEPVHIGEKIMTAAQSGVGVQLDPALALRLGAQGVVTVATVTAEGGGKIVLGAGPLLIDRATPRGKSAVRDDASRLVVETPYCTVTLNEDARVFAGPSKEVFGVFVDRGSVTVAARGKRVRLKQGEGTDVRRPGDSASPAARWKSERIRLALESVRVAPPEENQEKK